MKKVIQLIMCLLFSITLPSLVVGDSSNGFLNCDRESFSFSDLKYYKEKELIEGYCTCKSLSEKNKKLAELSLKLMLNYLQLGRTLQSDKASKDAEEYKQRENTAKVNLYRILRILEKEHQYKNVPECTNGGNK
jgi:hypothetical protein